MPRFTIRRWMAIVAATAVAISGWWKGLRRYQLSAHSQRGALEFEHHEGECDQSEASSMRNVARIKFALDACKRLHGELGPSEPPGSSDRRSRLTMEMIDLDLSLGSARVAAAREANETGPWSKTRL